jgi:hypothetical protein
MKSLKKGKANIDISLFCMPVRLPDINMNQLITYHDSLLTCPSKWLRPFVGVGLKTVYPPKLPRYNPDTPFATAPASRSPSRGNSLIFWLYGILFFMIDHYMIERIVLFIPLNHVSSSQCCFCNASL